MHIEDKISRLEALISEVGRRRTVEEERDGDIRPTHIGLFSSALVEQAQHTLRGLKELRKEYRRFKIKNALKKALFLEDINGITKTYSSIVGSIRGMSENFNKLIQAIYDSPSKMERPSDIEDEWHKRYGNKIPHTMRELMPDTGAGENLWDIIDMEYKRNRPFVEMRHTAIHGMPHAGIYVFASDYGIKELKAFQLPKIIPREEFIPEYMREGKDAASIQITKFLENITGKQLDHITYVLETILTKDEKNFLARTAKDSKSVKTHVNLDRISRYTSRALQYMLIGTTLFFGYKYLEYKTKLAESIRDTQIRNSDFMSNRMDDNRFVMTLIPPKETNWNEYLRNSVLSGEEKVCLELYLNRFHSINPEATQEILASINKNVGLYDTNKTSKLKKGQLDQMVMQLEKDNILRLNKEKFLQNKYVFESAVVDGLTGRESLFLSKYVHDPIVSDIIRAKAVANFAMTGKATSNSQVKEWAEKIFNYYDAKLRDKNITPLYASKEIDEIFELLGEDTFLPRYMLENHTMFYMHLQRIAKVPTKNYQGVYWQHIDNDTLMQFFGEYEPQFPIDGLLESEYINHPSLKIKTPPERIRLPE